MAGIIATYGLGRRYGSFWALRDLELVVEEGCIYGLLGPNGAGKTTTLRLLATLLAPTVGGATVAGSDLLRQPGRVRRLIGYMPDDFGVYDDLTVVEYLDFYATAHGVRGAGRWQMLRDLLDIVGLADRRDGYVEALSRGMKQRLGIARCLVHDPPVLLLDEPASGLDPLARLEVQTLLGELARLGKTVVISSHILPELASLCTHVGVVDGGRLLVDGRVAELLAAAAERSPLQVELAGSVAAEQAAALLRQQPGVTEVRGGYVTLDVVTDPGTDVDAALFVAVGQAGLPVRRFGRRAATLEDVYFAVARPALAEPA